MSGQSINNEQITNEQDPLAAAMADPRPMSQTYNKAKIFMDALNEVLAIIENIPEIKDGDYLNACNALKVLNDNRTIIIQNVRNTAIVIENTARVRRERRERVVLDDNIRISEGIAERCSKCERVVCKRQDQANGVGVNIKLHKQRDICSNIYSAKRIALKVGVADLAPYLNVINAIRKWAIATNRPIFYE